ncbi:MAG: winged helix-turn-helix domain-containing protein [Gammaproteobacteria bacterium]
MTANQGPQESAQRMQRTAEVTHAADETGYRVDDLIIDTGRQCVTRGDSEISLSGLSFELLLALVRDAPDLVTYDRLMERVWPGLVVSPETVSQRVKLVRDALGDDSHAPRYIAGVRGRGYRMLAAVTPLSATLPTPATGTAQAPEPDRRAPVLRRASGRWWGIAAVGVGALLIVGVVLLIEVRAPDGSPTQEAEESSIAIRPVRTIAVLPFANLSGSPEYEYFSDGLTEELLNRLTDISELQVAARTSSFHFKGKNETAQTIGQTLRVRHLLEGSVRKQGDQIRVTAQLVSAENGYRLWAQTFERQMADIFALQDEIALAVAENLQLRMASEVRSSLASRGGTRPTTNTDAYLSYLRAKHLAWRDQQKLALQEFQRSAAIDPNYAGAHVGIASTYIGLTEADYLTEGEALPPARAAIERALELDPDLAQAWAVKGNLLFFEGAPAAKVLPVLERAVALNPNDTQALNALAWAYDDQGRRQDARRLWERAYRLDPLVEHLGRLLALSHHDLGDSLRAAEVIAELERLSPESADQVRADIAFREGRFDDNARAWARVVKADPAGLMRYLWLAEAYLYIGDVDSAARYTEAAARRDPDYPRILMRRVDILVARGDAAGARATLDAATSKVPGSTVHYAHGHFFYLTRDCARSVKSYQSAMPGLNHPEPKIPNLTLYRAIGAVPTIVWCLRELGEPARADTLSGAFGTYLRKAESPGERAHVAWLRARMAAANGERAAVIKHLSALWSTGGMLPAWIPGEPLFAPHARNPEVKALLAKFETRRAERRAGLAAEGL